MDRQAPRDIRRKLNCSQFARECGSVVLTGRQFGVAKSSFYRWQACADNNSGITAASALPVSENPTAGRP